MAKKNANGLTDLQQAFADAYLLQPLNSRSAAAAYRSVRPKASARVAEVTGARMLSIAEVAAYVKEQDAQLLEPIADRYQITQERVLEELANLAFYDPAELGLAHVQGPEDIANLPERVRRCIVGWAWDKNENFTLKLSSKQAALEALGRHLKLFTDKVEHSGEVKGGGLVLLPATASHDEWQKMAQSQAQSGK